MMSSAAGCTSSRLSAVASATNVCRSCCGEGVLELLIEWIDLAPDGISVTLHTAGTRSLVAEPADQEPPAPAASEALLEAAEQ